MNKYANYMVVALLVLAGSLSLGSCGKIGAAIDPGDWGYDCKVVYDAMGGTINSKSSRLTYYLQNSYIFKPSGTTNMLIDPVRDGYILSGWYINKTDIPARDGKPASYSFAPDDRWDFDEDRVQADTNLYARWIPQGKVDYVDAETGQLKFSKNISETSGITALTSAAEFLIKKTGYVFEGYYADQACTKPFVFSDAVIKALIPSNEAVYKELASYFPDYFEQVEYQAPEEHESTLTDTSDHYMNKLGYQLTEAGKAARDLIRAKKNAIYEQAIMDYSKNTVSQTVYLKYTKGGMLQVAKAEDLRSDGKIWFSGFDKSGNPVDGYIIVSDIDFKGLVVSSAEKFSGKINGNGHALKNITFSISSKVIDTDRNKTAALFQELDGAQIENLRIENMAIKLSVNSGIEVTAAPLAANAANTTLKNVRITGLTIDTGKGDDGAAAYRIGDLFASEKNSSLSGVTGTGISIKASKNARINYMLLK